MISHWRIRTVSDRWFSKILRIRPGSDSISTDQTGLGLENITVRWSLIPISSDHHRKFSPIMIMVHWQKLISQCATNWICQQHVWNFVKMTMTRSIDRYSNCVIRWKRDWIQVFTTWFFNVSRVTKNLDSSHAITGRSLRGLFKCYCHSTNIAEFWLHRCLAKFEQVSDSQIEQNPWLVLSEFCDFCEISGLFLFFSYFGS